MLWHSTADSASAGRHVLGPFRGASQRACVPVDYLNQPLENWSAGAQVAHACRLRPPARVHWLGSGRPAAPSDASLSVTSVPFSLASAPAPTRQAAVRQTAQNGTDGPPTSMDCCRRESGKEFLPFPGLFPLAAASETRPVGKRRGSGAAASDSELGGGVRSSAGSPNLVLLRCRH